MKNRRRGGTKRHHTHTREKRGEEAARNSNSIRKTKTEKLRQGKGERDGATLNTLLGFCNRQQRSVEDKSEGCKLIYIYIYMYFF